MKVVVFDSAVDDFFLNHSDFLARIEDLTQHTSRADGARGMAGHTRSPDARARRVDRLNPGPRDRERK